MSAGDFDLVVDPHDGKGYYYFERVHSRDDLRRPDRLTTPTSPGYYSTHFPQPQPPFVREAPAYFARERQHYLITSGTTGYYPNPSEVAVAPSYHGPSRCSATCIRPTTSRTSFHSQISSVFRHPGKKDLYIAIADRWLPGYLDHGARAQEAFIEHFAPGRDSDEPMEEFAARRHVDRRLRLAAHPVRRRPRPHRVARRMAHRGLHMTTTTTIAGTWHDRLLEPSHRADLLLAEMTVAEKCHQLTSRMPWSLISADGSDAAGADDVLRNPPGHIAQLIHNDAAQLAAMVGTIQHQVLSRSRLGIPVLFHAEALSGFLAGGHMVFPSGTGLAAGWSPDLVEQMADLIRRQMRRTGMMHALSPVLDVALDPRWGRVHETFGEDPYLCAALGVAYVRSLQGQDLSQGVMATGKHFLGYAVPLGGMNTASFEAGARATRDLFAYPFEAAIQLAGLRSVMNSYSDIDGIPAGGSPEVLQDLLRDTLGFEGFVSSDYGTIERLVTSSGSRPTPRRRAGWRSRRDWTWSFPTRSGTATCSRRRSRVEQSTCGTSTAASGGCCARSSRWGSSSIPTRRSGSTSPRWPREGSDLSQELARRSIVLAKNSGLLPLSPGVLDVAVVGPHANAPSLQFPTYTYASWREANEAIIQGELGTMNGAEDTVTAWYETISDGQDAHSLVQDRYGARSLVAELGEHVRSIRTEPGCALTRDLGDEALQRAVAAAREADVAVLALGGASLWFTGERTEGEASDTADITLPAAQVHLAEAIAATGTPMVVVLVQGRAYALPQVVQDAAAIVIAPYAGPFGNRSIADVLVGMVNPSGKLPYSIPRHSGQLPVYHHQKAGSGYRNPLSPGVMQRYLDLEATPLWPFGHGHSYSTFVLSDLDCGPDIDTKGTARIGATVENAGDRDGAVVVQLYLRVNTTGVTRPAQQLGGFARVQLAPGQQQRVTFAVDASQLACTNLARQIAVEPARVDVFVGFDSDDRSLAGAFHVTGAPRIVPGTERSFLSTVSLDLPVLHYPAPRGREAHERHPAGAPDGSLR